MNILQESDSSAMNCRRHLRRPRRICLFGTSANPPTGKGGHAGIIRALVELRKFNEVKVLPVYRHTFVSKRDQLLGFDHRVAMCKLAVEELSSEEADPMAEANESVRTKVVVSRTEEKSFHRMIASSQAESDEEKSSLRVGTADLLEMLMENEEREETDATSPKTEFSFCLGADTFMDLTDWKWKRSKDVLKLLGGRLVVVNRKQEAPKDDQQQDQQPEPSNDSLKERIEETNASPLGNGQIVLLDVPSLDDVSSSKVRNLQDKDLVKTMLSPKVLDYVIANNLYGFEKKKEEGSIRGGCRSSQGASRFELGSGQTLL